MTDMMLTGRVYNAEDGERAGFAQYLVPEGTAFDKALELAQRVAAERAADQLRADARPAAHRRAAGRPGLLHRSADGGHRAERARGQGSACATSWKARRRRSRRTEPLAQQRPQGNNRMNETRPAPRYRPLDFGITRGVLREGAPGRALPRSRGTAGQACHAHDRPPAALGRGRARPHLHGAPRTRRRRQHRRLDSRELRRGAARRAQPSPRRCSTAACRPSGRSPSSARTASSMR